MSKVTEIITALAGPEAERLGLELWDVEYIKEAGRWYVRLYIDKEGGVSINDCEALSRAVDPLLDEADPVPTSYTFEVCSAGAERELKRPGDFARFMGAFVEVRHYQPVEGAKLHLGHLAAWEDGAVTLETAEGTLRFDKSQVAQVRLRIQ